jgi:DNA repair protein RadC
MNEESGVEGGLAIADHPRTKLLKRGINALSDAEVLSLVIGAGTKEKSALELANSVLKRSFGALTELVRLNVPDLCSITGIGEAKAIAIISAFELARRKAEERISERHRIIRSSDAAALFEFLADLPHEEFWILLLRRNNSVITSQRISVGGMAGTLVDSRILFKTALDYRASQVLLCHNHPSGHVIPSEPDIQLTQRLCYAGKVLEIVVTDHLIIGHKEYYSFADEGRMT